MTKRQFTDGEKGVWQFALVWFVDQAHDSVYLHEKFDYFSSHGKCICAGSVQRQSFSFWNRNFFAMRQLHAVAYVSCENVGFEWLPSYIKK